jgi:hypothetical protein
MKIDFKYELYGLVWNLLNGFKLAAFRKVDSNVFRNGLDQNNSFGSVL